jgi:HSP20 family molecular chaperone IbpA
MFFATTNPAFQGRSVFRPTNRSLERFMTAALQGSHAQACTVAQDDTSYTLSFDVPGISREQLSIGIEGSVVRIDTTEGAPRKYRAAYELPTDLDVASSQAKLENGVLTLKLAKQVPVSKLTQLVVN